MSLGIYGLLGNTTRSNFSGVPGAGVIIVPNPNAYMHLQEAGEAIVAYRNRVWPTYTFGNPFVRLTTRESVEEFMMWVIDGDDDHAKWMREAFWSKVFKGKPIYYGNTRSTKANVPSHATAIDWFVNSIGSPFNR